MSSYYRPDHPRHQPSDADAWRIRREIEEAENTLRRQPPFRLFLGAMGTLLLGAIFFAIMAMAISALLGVDPTNPGRGNSPVPTEVHKP